jgi:hypothetical protein
MPHTRLSVLNIALLELGQTELRVLGAADPHEREIVMAAQWESCVRHVAERGYWNVIQKTESLTAFTPATPAPGFLHVIAKPSGWYRTMWVKASINDTREIEYLDEGAVWFTNYETVVARWIDQQALDDFYIPAWPELFVECVAYKLAARCAKRLTGSDEAAEKAETKLKTALKLAKATDAMNQPADNQSGNGSWVRSGRGGRYGSNGRSWR